MRTLFIGYFTPLELIHDGSSGSVAGAKVQEAITNCLDHSVETSSLVAIVMRETPNWPGGPILLPRRKVGLFNCSPILNLPILKRFSFSLEILRSVITYSPKNIYVYNPGPLEAAVLSLISGLKKIKVCAFVYDYYPAGNMKFELRAVWQGVSQIVSVWFLRRFEALVVPTSAIRDKAKFSKNKTVIFPGATSSMGLELMGNDDPSLQKLRAQENYFVLAASLEPYNMARALAEAWIRLGIKAKLLIVGQGSEVKFIERLVNYESSIEFLGHRLPDEVRFLQRNATANFCLRADVGINQEYFFPSKFFDISGLEPWVISNEFKNLPLSLRDYVFLLDDNFKNLPDAVAYCIKNRSDENFRCRRLVLSSDHTWESCMAAIKRLPLGEVLQGDSIEL